MILLLLICSLNIDAQTEKMSPFVRKVVMKESVASAKAKGREGKTPRMTAFVRCSDMNILRQEGCMIYAQWDDICIASIPIYKLGHLASMRQIQRIEAGEPCFINNDTTSIVTKARDVWNLPIGENLTGLTGKGVVVGVMDIGFDLTHPTYYSSDGERYRVKALWDLLETPSLKSEAWDYGEAVMGEDSIYIGRQYIGEEALMAKKHSVDGITQTHGTHTSGTAAGSGWEGIYMYNLPCTMYNFSVNSEQLSVNSEQLTVNSEPTTLENLERLENLEPLKTKQPKTQNQQPKTVNKTQNPQPTTQNPKNTTYPGMAPDADICLVANFTGDNSDMVSEEYIYQYTTATDMLGFKYIFDYAESVGKPCVINFSEGAHADLYESPLYEEVMEKLTGSGRILCASAGNEGGKGSYLSKPRGMEKTGAFLGSYSANALYVMKSDKPILLELAFHTTASEQVKWTYDATALKDYPDSIYCDTMTVDGNDYEIMLNTYPSEYNDGKWATDFLVTDLSGRSISSSTPKMSLWLMGTDNVIEAYNAGGFFVVSNVDASLYNFTYDHNILFPGMLESVVCVGNAGYRTTYLNHNDQWMKIYDQTTTNGKKSRNSSMGPTIDGRVKPDVMAPGMNVISSYSSFYHEHNGNMTTEVRHFLHDGRTYSWGEISGTSMSSPAVTGIIALWLQLCPTLTPAQIKDVFANTCTHYDEDMTYPNNQYGWGNIDALAGIRYIQKNYTGIEEITLDDDDRNTPTGIFTLAGMKIHNKTPHHGVYIISDRRKTKKVIL